MKMMMMTAIGLTRMRRCTDKMETHILNILDKLVNADSNDTVGDRQLNLDSPQCRKMVSKVLADGILDRLDDLWLMREDILKTENDA
jgi:hypothetical protein